jgi:hypothetical protein
VRTLLTLLLSLALVPAALASDGVLEINATFHRSRGFREVGPIQERRVGSFSATTAPSATYRNRDDEARDIRRHGLLIEPLVVTRNGNLLGENAATARTSSR